MIRYTIPHRWIRYDGQAITQTLATAKATILSLRTLPYQKQWVERLQKIELKREVAGTSRIEGADFSERELDEAIEGSPERLVTRSQRQAHAAVQTYRWIATLPDDRPISADLIREIHRRIVTGADDDHCPPGQLRKQDENVNFGSPRHRGAEGGGEIITAFEGLVNAIQREFRDHDPIVQAMAAHYHIAAMHPFLDGNGRTARALEALLLQRAGLRDSAFIAMSNYYYDEKPGYLKALADARAGEHGLTPFLRFGLKGIEVQGGRMLAEMRHEMQKEVFRSLAQRLFTRLKSKRKRVIGERQLQLLERLLDRGEMRLDALYDATAMHYRNLKNPIRAAVVDALNLESIGAVAFSGDQTQGFMVRIRLDWPTRITESEFFELIKTLPRAKSHPFLR
jgi:cell filamentation protein, protein adenylyltransferase